MKKLYLPAVVIAAITLASCAKQEIMTEPTPVQFDTFVGKSAGVQTKGMEFGLNYLQALGFRVQAYTTGTTDWENYNHTTPSTGGDFMSNQHVTASSGPWEYTPVAYWPKNGGKVTFFAGLFMGDSPYAEIFKTHVVFTGPMGENGRPSI